MDTPRLPDRAEMLDAFNRRDGGYEGVFVTAVRTTGVFCRPTCPARKPKPENVEFFARPREALQAGYRPCLRCRPMRTPGQAPGWLAGLLSEVDGDPTRRWRDADLVERGLDPVRVRRWFKTHHGMTFHAYSRARRLGSALGRIQQGEPVSRTAFDSGFDSLSGFSEAFRKLVGQPPTGADDAEAIRVTRIPTPLGPMVAAASGDALLLLEFSDRPMLSTQLGKVARRGPTVFVPGGNDVTAEAAAQVDAYFAGRLRSFDLPLEHPATDFQLEVWEALRAIPFGTTRSYLDVARAVGRPTAVRAVARANGANRLAILIPCHRVIGADGTLTGYGGGLWRKRRLLDLERGALAGG